MRHVLVHDYYQISDEMVWATIQTELLPLKEKVELYKWIHFYCFFYLVENCSKFNYIYPIEILFTNLRISIRDMN